jgi:predicted ATP-binding protein involved in virulence
MLPSKDDVADELIRWHFLAAPETREIYRIFSPNEAAEGEPIKLLEVRATPGESSGPIEFEATYEVPYRSIIVQQPRADALPVPEGWTLDAARKYERPAEDGRSFHIDELSLVNFRPFERRKFQFGSNVNVLIGKNGTGKTAILDALAVAVRPLLAGLEPRASRDIHPDDARRVSYDKGGELTIEPQSPVRVECRGIAPESQFHWEIEYPFGGDPSGGLFRFASFLAEAVRKGLDVTLPLMAYYGTGRLWRRKSQDVDIMKPGSRLRGYAGCLDQAYDLQDVWSWFKRMELIQLQGGVELGTLAAAKRAIDSCLDGWSNVRFDVRIGDIVAQAKDGPTLEFRMLSDGVRNMLAMVADMAYRAAILNPHLGADVVAKTPGIVLIDELDLHLHPTWQRRVLDDLRRTFPRVQFFATTHSPFIVQSLRPGELTDLDDDQPGDYYKRSIEDIAEGVMGVELPQRSLRWQEMKKAAEEYYRLLRERKGSPEELAQRKARLDELIAPFSDDPAYVAFLEMEREAAGLGKGDE